MIVVKTWDVWLIWFAKWVLPAHLVGLHKWGGWLSVWHAVWDQGFRDASLMLKLIRHTLHENLLSTLTSLWLVMTIRPSRGIRTWGLVLPLSEVVRSGKLIRIVADRVRIFLASSTTLIKFAATGSGTCSCWAAAFLWLFTLLIILKCGIA